MKSDSHPRLVMLGPAPETHCGLAVVVDIYRMHGLFRRWPVDYVATHGPGGRGVRIGHALRGLRDFAALVARRRPLVVHLHTTAGLNFWRDAPYMATGLAAGCPLLLHLHGGGFDRFYDAAARPVRALVREVLERAACVLVPCESVLASVRGIAREAHVLRLNNPVSLPQVSTGPRPNLIVFLGRLEREKGLFDLLEALAAVRAGVPDVRLVCAGEGDRDAVLRHAERLGVADAVRLTGWVGPGGKRALFESAAVYALPSYAEGLPLNLLEAMAAGVPVVASRVGGIQDVVVDGTSGLLVAPGDIARLQGALRRLLLDSALAARIGAAARETVRARFSPEHTLPKLENIYANLGIAQSSVEAPPWPASLAG